MEPTLTVHSALYGLHVHCSRIPYHEHRSPQHYYLHTTSNHSLIQYFQLAFHHTLEAFLDALYVTNAIAITVNTPGDGCRLCFQYTPCPRDGAIHTVAHRNISIVFLMFQYVLGAVVSTMAAPIYDTLSRYQNIDGGVSFVNTPNAPPPRPPLKPYPTSQPQTDFDLA
jgi:hypothetical protein